MFIRSLRSPGGAMIGAAWLRNGSLWLGCGRCRWREKGRWEGFPPPASRKDQLTSKLTRIIHVEFDGARSGLPAHHFLPLEVDVAVDLIVAEDVALGQESPVVGQADQRLAKRSADRRNVDQLLRGKVVEVLVHRVAGVDPVPDAVEARHQKGRISEIGV